ncbi:MAG TPA: ABC transporter ATP-binding protein [Candidatus Methanoperedens sp.]|nr:ABC transporter ATP-binding protein [Candidatus Methanoperedens sp.]
MRHDHLIDESETRAIDRVLLARLLGYLAPYRWRIALAILLLFGAAALQLAGPYLVKVGIDEHIARGDLRGLDRIAVLFFAVALAGFALRYAQTLLTYRIGQRAMLDLRLAVFDRIESQSLAYFDRNPTGRLMTRVGSDVEVLQELFSTGAITVFGDLFTVAGVVVAMLAINARLALVSFAVLPLLFAATVFFRSRVRRSFRAIRQRVARMNAFLNEHLSGIGVVKLFSRERAAATRFERINDEHRQAFLGAVLAYAIFFPVVEIIGAVAIALLLGYGGAQILAGALSFGGLVAFLEYVQRFYKPVQDLAEKFNILQSAMAAAERIFAVLDTAPAIVDPPRPLPLTRSRGRVEFRDVRFAYAPGQDVLRRISLRVEPGEMVAIVGATGAGKTSLISLLARLYDPQEGAVLLDGVDVRALALRDLRRQMAVVLQEVFLFSGTVLENIALANPAITRAAAIEAARRVGADGFIRALPRGYESEVGERGVLLSAGQKQLLSFARALAHDPPLLVLDEATSSVDSQSEALIQEALDILFAGRTSLVIAHRLSTIRGADRIVALHKGRIRESGTHAELLQAGGIYAKLYRLQYVGG